MLVRGAFVLIAAAIIVFGATRLHDTTACTDAKNAAIAAALGHRPPGGPQPLANRVADHCRDSRDLAAAGGALVRAGDLTVAEGLARKAVARDPRGYLGWASLAAVLQRRNMLAASRAAARQSLALNPRYAAARQLAAPAGAGAPSGP